MTNIALAALVPALLVAVAGCGPAFDAQSEIATPPETQATGKPEQRTEKPGPAPEQVHFDRIRSARPCELVKSDHLNKFGGIVGTKQTGISACVVGAGGENGPINLFYLTLDDSFDDMDAEDGERHGTVAGRPLYKADTVAGDERSACTYQLPYEGVERALKVRAVKTQAGGAPWPEACGAAKEYLANVVGKVDQLRPEPKPVRGDIIGQDPCARQEAIEGAFPGFQIDETIYLSAYRCTIELKKPDAGADRSYTVDVHFSLKEKQGLFPGPGSIRDEHMTMGGFEGLRMASDMGSFTTCQNTLTTKPGSDPEARDFHLLSLILTTNSDTPEGAPEVNWDAPLTDCAKTDELTRMVLDDINK